MSPLKKVVEYHIARLQDKRAETRMSAIKELELLNAVDALDVLQEVYQTDPDKAVRKAAQEAGRQIFRSQKLNGASNGTIETEQT